MKLARLWDSGDHKWTRKEAEEWVSVWNGRDSLIPEYPEVAYSLADWRKPARRITPARQDGQDTDRVSEGGYR